VEATDFIYKENVIVGVQALDRETGEHLNIKTTVVVNATGPWVDDIREINKSKEGKTLHLTKGVHIVVAHDKLPVKQSIYFDVGDGRMIFAIPRGSKTYVGTTDTNYEGSKDEVFANKNDVDYLLTAVNNTFQGTSLKTTDIESSWAGLRPLIHEEGKSASELSRKDEIFLSGSGLISIAGGKLTGYRKMAERVVDLVIEKAFAGKNWNECATQSILLTDEPFKNANEVGNYIGKLRNILTARGGDARLAAYLVNNYGKRSGKLIDSASGSGREFDEALLREEVLLSLNEEMAVRPLDFLVRRSGMLLFNTDRMRDHLQIVLDQFSERKKWTREEWIKEKNKVEEYIKASAQFQ
jgi:glycerol-3-phosphate dehydrogenase